MTRLMRFARARTRDRAITDWLARRPDPLGEIASHWFEVMRACGDDVRELLHDGYPTACVEDSAFAYVGVFTSHVNVGFFLGATLPDPDSLLTGAGRFMRHVKCRPGDGVDPAALTALIHASYADMKARM